MGSQGGSSVGGLQDATQGGSGIVSVDNSVFWENEDSLGGTALSRMGALPVRKLLLTLAQPISARPSRLKLLLQALDFGFRLPQPHFARQLSKTRCPFR